MTKKEEPFRWEQPQQHAFDTLKEHFTKAPVLAFPDLDCKFRLESDASDYATGAVLSIGKDCIWHLIAFSSHSMTPQEQNYLVANKEMLSVIQALEQWRHYLEGARHQFEIWNDHANLQWFMTRQDLNCRQARWAMYLSQFTALCKSLWKMQSKIHVWRCRTPSSAEHVGNVTPITHHGPHYSLALTTTHHGCMM